MWRRAKTAQAASRSSQLERTGLREDTSAAAIHLAVHQGLLHDRYKEQSVLALAIDLTTVCHDAKAYQLVLSMPMRGTEQADRAGSTTSGNRSARSQRSSAASWLPSSSGSSAVTRLSCAS